MYDYVDSEQHPRTDQRDCQHADRVARLCDAAVAGAVERRSIPLVALAPQQESDPEDAGEHDELLAERIEAANIDVDRCHRIGDLALGYGDPVDEVGVGVVRVDTRERGCEDRGEDDGRNQKQTQARLGIHRWTLLRIFASASRIMRGSASAPIVIWESATSGAWNRKNIKARRMP